MDQAGVTYFAGERPKGIIMYTPDGYMSAQLMHPDRRPFASGDWFEGTNDEYREEASTYIAYSGPFHVDEEKQKQIDCNTVHDVCALANERRDIIRTSTTWNIAHTIDCNVRVKNKYSQETGEELNCI